MESETYIKAFHNIPIEIDSIVLNSKGLFPFCASRSGNNEISVIVEGGVFVLVSYTFKIYKHLGQSAFCYIFCITSNASLNYA